MSQERAIYPLAKAAAQPAITGSAPIEDETSPKSFSSRINAPKIAGIETMKENSPATSRLTPQKSAPAIVEPLLEIPGNVPIPCANPIAKDCFQDGEFKDVSEEDECFFSRSEEKIKSKAVTTNPAQTAFTEISEMTFEEKTPSTPVTKVARIMATMYFVSSDFFSIWTAEGFFTGTKILAKLQISSHIFFLKYKTTASKVAT